MMAVHAPLSVPFMTARDGSNNSPVIAMIQRYPECQPEDLSLRLLRFRHVLLLMGAWVSATLYAETEASRPNVVILYTDDQGTLDAGCYGSSDLHTPHIDRIAANGVRFTQAYAHTVCCPSRAALLTGRHPQRSGINSWTQGKPERARRDQHGPSRGHDRRGSKDGWLQDGAVWKMARGGPSRLRSDEAGIRRVFRDPKRPSSITSITTFSMARDITICMRARPRFSVKVSISRP